MLILLGTLACVAAFGQATSGTMFGTVQDPTGAVVADATVTATAPNIGLTRTTTSNQSGDFAFPNLPPATYNVEVTAKGFKTHVTTGVVVGATDRVSAGAQVLEVGGTGTSVTVTAEGAQIQLQSNSGERSDTITSKQLNNVALNGRMVLDYMKLVPGVISSFDGHQSGTGGIDAFNINGTRANEHEFTIDGASNVDTGNNGGTHVTINTDAIQEVKILTSNYQAEYGKAAGGQVIVTTKSGTSQFHGDARIFHRHEGLNANEWFNKRDQIQNNQPNQPGKYRYNYFGYQIGGPVIVPGTDFNKNKDKVFFFWGQEYYRQLLPVNGDRVTFYTPTALERVGDFSQSVDGNGLPVQISGPGIVPGTNKIDRSLLNPAQQAVFDQVSKILSLYPLPNVASAYGNGTNNYNYLTTFSPANPRREDIFRLDYQINAANRFFGRYIGNSDTTSGPVLPWPGYGTFACTGGIVFSGGCTSKHPGWNLSINLISTITPNLLNEFSFGPSVSSTYSSGKGGNLSVGANGIDMPLLYPVSPDQSIPDLGFGGLNNTNFGWTYLGATPWHQANTTINLNDNVSWVKSGHTFKFGVFYQRNRKDQIAWGNVNGQFSFGVGPTSPSGCDSNVSACGDPLASALLGSFDSFSQSASRPVGYFRYNQLEFYAQDTWKVTPRFTLDYGMRFAWVPPQTDARNQVAIFDPAAYDPAKAVAIDPNSGNIILNDQPGGNPNGDPLNGMVFTANHQIPAGGWNDRGVMPEPRIGFAYDLSDDHKTVLRGGFGMMHDRTQGNLIFNEVFNNPVLDAKPAIYNNNIANLGSVSVAANTSPLGAIYGASRDGKVPTVYSFSLGIQHELTNSTTLDLAYVGTLSRHLTTARDINAIPYGTEFTAAAQNPNATFAWWSPNSGQTCFPGGVVGPEPGLPTQYSDAGYSYSSACAYPTSYLVPYKGYGQMEYLEFNGNGNYNSLQASLQRRFAQGLTFGVVYTWSKAMTTANSDEDFLDPFINSIMYRRASFDRTHVFAANYVYNLPNVTKHFGGPKWLSFITDDFQLSGITQFMSGNPLYPTSYWWNTTENQVTGSNDWGKMPIFMYVNNDGTFQTPKLGAPTKPNWDLYRSGGMQDWDMSLFKNIKFTEARYIQLRLEAFNVFNHPNFYGKELGYGLNSASGSTPMSYSTAGNFGQYTSTYSGTGGPRVVQLGAKFYF
ncbi:MAG: carboxypeptidase regulatory-like domain-containing protein [Terriglobia bacterium]|nr:carboxypeptidase regulatory-like domain-containing protein [Terriglobia bacterium]